MPLLAPLTRRALLLLERKERIYVRTLLRPPMTLGERVDPGLVTSAPRSQNTAAMTTDSTTGSRSP